MISLYVKMLLQSTLALASAVSAQCHYIGMLPIKDLQGVSLLSSWIRLQLLLSVWCIYFHTGHDRTSSLTWCAVNSEMEWFEFVCCKGLRFGLDICL